MQNRWLFKNAPTKSTKDTHPSPTSPNILTNRPHSGKSTKITISIWLWTNFGMNFLIPHPLLDSIGCRKSKDSGTSNSLTSQTQSELWRSWFPWPVFHSWSKPAWPKLSHLFTEAATKSFLKLRVRRMRRRIPTPLSARRLGSWSARPRTPRTQWSSSPNYTRSSSVSTLCSRVRSRLAPKKASLSACRNGTNMPKKMATWTRRPPSRRPQLKKKKSLLSLLLTTVVLPALPKFKAKKLQSQMNLQHQTNSRRKWPSKIRKLCSRIRQCNQVC